ncbi:MAG: hypothetical protein HFE77_03265 [Clostridiales bacterium]|nr:hypothetical protein [Clostridiales bacterium]
MYYLSKKARKALKVLNSADHFEEYSLPKKCDHFRADSLVRQGLAEWFQLVPKGKEDFPYGLRGLRITPEGEDALRNFFVQSLLTCIPIILSIASFGFSVFTFVYTRLG